MRRKHDPAYEMTKQRSRVNVLALLVAVVPPTLIITWGELSEFNVNLWFLPTVNVPASFLNFEELLIASYYLLTPSMILLYLKSSQVFRDYKNRFLVLVIVTVSAFFLLRYLEFLYDLNGTPVADPFGTFYPLAFWGLPLLVVATASFFLSARS